jgi:FeS assembly SUF system protein
MISKDKIIEVLKTVFDPEIPVNIWDLGIVYNIDISDNNDVTITMTMTAPNCPISEMIIDDVKSSLSNIEGINDIKINLTFNPPWSPDMMSEEAKLQLGLF